LLSLSNLIHISIGSGSRCGSRSSSVANSLRGRGDKIVSHLWVEFLLSLLCRTAVATTALLVGSSLGRSLGRTSGVLVSSSGLGLSLGLGLGLGSTLSEGLGGRNDLVSLSGPDNNLNLDWSVVDKKTIQLLEGIASAIGLVESDVGDTATLWVGAVDKLYSLDRSNRLDEIVLLEKRQYSEVYGWTKFVVPFPSLGRSSSGRILHRQDLVVVMVEQQAEQRDSLNPRSVPHRIKISRSIRDHTHMALIPNGPLLRDPTQVLLLLT
jgi:hypothetical protein